MDTSIFLHTISYKFVIIVYEFLGLLKGGDRNLIGCSRPNFSPKLEPILTFFLLSWVPSNSG